MKKLLCFALLLCALCIVASADSVIFAFDALGYDVMSGKTLKLKPIMQGSSASLSYTWSSSDTSIVTVEKNGTVKGISPGTAEVMCIGKTKSGAEYTAICSVNVLQSVSKITAVETNVELLAPSFYFPEVIIEPENAAIKDIEWKSSNKNVILGSEQGPCLVCGAGSATLTGKAVDGSGTTVKINVKVNKVYTTHDEIIIKDKEGIEFGYHFNAIGGGSVNYTGNCFNTEDVKKEFSLQDIYDGKDNIEYCKIIPVKYGSGAIVFKVNGSVVKTVNIKVQHSAVYDDVSYPTVKISQVLANKDKYLNQNHSVSVEIKAPKTYKYNNTRMENGPIGIVYCATGTTGEYMVAFEYNHNQEFETGSDYILYGTIVRYESYTTETGLRYDCPVFSNIKLVKDKH